MALLVAKLLALVVALFLWQPVAAWLPISRSTSQRIEHRVVRRAITSPPPPNSLEFTKENVDEVNNCSMISISSFGCIVLITCIYNTSVLKQVVCRLCYEARELGLTVSMDTHARCLNKCGRTSFPTAGTFAWLEWSPARFQCWLSWKAPVVAAPLPLRPCKWALKG